MTTSTTRTTVRPLSILLVAAAAAGLSACSSVDPQTRLTRELLGMPKEEAYARGDSLVTRKKLETGRQYLRFVAENYANDPVGKQAALRLADSYFDEKTPLGYLEAQARFKDFRSRYPSHPKSDYALFRLAQCSDRQAEKPDRDQSNTRLAASSYRDLLQQYPDSPYAVEARARLKTMRGLLAEHEYRVANFYFKRRAWDAAKGRYDLVLGAFPDFWKLDRVLYEAGWVEFRLGRAEDARLLVQKLAEAFPDSPLLKKKLPVRPAPVAAPSPAPVASAGGGV